MLPWYIQKSIDPSIGFSSGAAGDGAAGHGVVGDGVVGDGVAGDGAAAAGHGAVGDGVQMAPSRRPPYCSLFCFEH